MSEYTPTTDEVRGDYAHFQVPGGTRPVTGEFAEGIAEFNRWLAEVERSAAEKAWVEGVLDESWSREFGGTPENPYRRNEGENE